MPQDGLQENRTIDLPHARLDTKRRCHGGDRLREICLIDIDPGSDHDIFDFLRIRLHLRQDPADFSVVDHDVIRPLDPNGQSRRLPNCLRDRKPHDQRERRGMARFDVRAKKQGEVDVFALRADPGPAEPALSGSLLLGDPGNTGGFSGLPGLLHPLVAGTGGFPIQYLFIEVIRTLLPEKGSCAVCPVVFHTQYPVLMKIPRSRHQHATRIVRRLRRSN